MMTETFKCFNPYAKLDHGIGKGELHVIGNWIKQYYPDFNFLAEHKVCTDCRNQCLKIHAAPKKHGKNPVAGCSYREVKNDAVVAVFQNSPTSNEMTAASQNDKEGATITPPLGNVNDETSQESLKLSEALEHAYNCKLETCMIQPCSIVKMMLDQSQACRGNHASDVPCEECQNLLPFSNEHSKKCNSDSCALPFCKTLKICNAGRMLQSKWESDNAEELNTAAKEARSILNNRVKHAVHENDLILESNTWHRDHQKYLDARQEMVQILGNSTKFRNEFAPLYRYPPTTGTAVSNESQSMTAAPSGHGDALDCSIAGSGTPAKIPRLDDNNFEEVTDIRHMTQSVQAIIKDDVSEISVALDSDSTPLLRLHLKRQSTAASGSPSTNKNKKCRFIIKLPENRKKLIERYSSQGQSSATGTRITTVKNLQNNLQQPISQNRSAGNVRITSSLMPMPTSYSTVSHHLDNFMNPAHLASYKFHEMHPSLHSVLPAQSVPYNISEPPNIPFFITHPEVGFNNFHHNDFGANNRSSQSQ